MYNTVHSHPTKTNAIYLIQNRTSLHRNSCVEFYLYSPVCIINDTGFDFLLFSHKLSYYIFEGECLFPDQNITEFKLGDSNTKKKPKIPYTNIEGGIGNV